MPNNYALTRSSKDQMGQEVILPIAPQRIISLVPSQTELLFDLGLDREIIGLTRFCVHPTDKVFLKTRIGGTKDFDFETIKSLEPDLIIGNKEENYQEGINELKKHFPVFYDEKGAVGRRYRRQDEAGTPYCITVDGQTLQDQTVTIRDRDTLKQERIAVKEVGPVIRERLRR